MSHEVQFMGWFVWFVPISLLCQHQCRQQVCLPCLPVSSYMRSRLVLQFKFRDNSHHSCLKGVFKLKTCSCADYMKFKCQGHVVLERWTKEGQDISHFTWLESKYYKLCDVWKKIFDNIVIVNLSVWFYRRGSPLVIGVKSKAKLSTDHIPILYSKGK